MKIKVLAIACVVAALAGCGGAKDGATKRKVVGVTLLTAGHEFYKDLEAGLREAAAANNIDLIVNACEMNSTKQASQIEDFVAQHVDAILAAPCDSDAVASALAGPEKAGIPVFTADIAAHNAKIVSHIASDNVQGGRLAAEALATAMGGKGKVAIINHPTVASVQERVSGFMEGLKKYPDITIVANLSADGDRVKATRVMEDLLQAHHDLSGVFGINDFSALGALGVLDAAGRKDIAIVGYDASDEAKAAILKGGPLKAEVVQSPKLIGKTAIEMIAKYFAGGTVPAVVAIDVSIVDAKSLAKK